MKQIKGKKVDNTLYKKIVKHLMYLTARRQNIMHVVSLISKYMKKLEEIHLLAAKWIFRYLKGTLILDSSIKMKKKIIFDWFHR